LKARTESKNKESVLSISGEGALKIIVDGDSTVFNRSGYAMVLNMKGGTTITSVNRSLLNVYSEATNAYSIPFNVLAGAITFERANVTTSSKQKNGANVTAAITAPADVIIDGSIIEHTSYECSSIFIKTSGNVIIRNHSKVIGTQDAGTPSYQDSGVYDRFTAIQAGSKKTITIDNSTVELINKAGCWRRMFNIMPTITNATGNYSTVDCYGICDRI
jgi:hypothetical protein